MKGRRKSPFNVAKFLATVDSGRAITTYRKNQKVFSQGDRADSVFYVQEGQVGAVAGVVGIESGVVSGVINLESSGVEAPDWRPRHDKRYHEA